MKNLINKFHNINFFIKTLIILSFIPLYYFSYFNEPWHHDELILTSTIYVIFAFFLFWKELEWIKNIFKNINPIKNDLLNNYVALEKLGDLKDKGLISEEEFNEQKKKLIKQ